MSFSWASKFKRVKSPFGFFASFRRQTPKVEENAFRTLFGSFWDKFMGTVRVTFYDKITILTNFFQTESTYLKSSLDNHLLCFTLTFSKCKNARSKILTQSVKLQTDWVCVALFIKKSFFWVGCWGLWVAYYRGETLLMGHFYCCRQPLKIKYPFC